MGTTIEDIGAEEAFEEEYKEREEQRIIEEFKSRGIRIEAALQIFDFLPIRQNVVESGYIKHLWDAFLTLDSFCAEGRAFLLMTFHLLFMLALQYKVLRIARDFPEASDVFFSGVAGRNKEQLLNLKRSVFDIALINERTIPELFGLVKLNKQDINKIKDLIDERNDNLAHAKGGIDPDPEGKIQGYLEVLNKIQVCINPFNVAIAKVWFSGIAVEDDIEEVLERQLQKSLFTPQDFGDVIEALLVADGFTPEQWQALVLKGFGFAENKTVSALKSISQNHKDKITRLKAIKSLEELG